jgi:uncharacterized membrane protein YkoI
MKHVMTVAILAAILTVPALADEGEFELLEHKVLKLAADKTKITAQQAIKAATKEIGEAKLVEVELYLKGDAPVFGLEFLTDAGELGIVVNAASGKVLEKEREEEDEDEAEEYEQAYKALSTAKITLAQAIETALREVEGGTVVEAEAEIEHGELEYEVKLLIGRVFKEVEIDSSGKVKEVEDEKAEGHAWIFDHDIVGKPPAGWEFGYTHPADGKATWTVKKDSNAFSGLNVLDLKAASADHVFNIAMAAGTSYQDVSLRTRIRANSGEEDQGGGVIWRCRDENNYYICRLNPLESNFRVYKVVDGRRKQLQSCRLDTYPGRWYVVRATMVGDHITCYVDGKKLLDVHDDTFPGAGMVGLWTKADASSSFDNVAAQAAWASKEEQLAEGRADLGKEVGEHDEDEDDDD